jgi:hypothetical protein
VYIHYNDNPFNLDTGDCVIRAISTALNYNWFMVHDELSFLSRKMADMPSSNRVWKQYLKEKGYAEEVIETHCPNCLTLIDFCRSHPQGRYILSTAEYTKARDNLIVTGTHLVAVIDGDYYDTWDSGDDIPLSHFYIYDK